MSNHNGNGNGGKGGLSPRQVKLIEGIIVNKLSVQKAALEAGYSERSAKNAGELLGRASMREHFASLLADPEKIAQRVNEGLDAMETKFATYEGKITDEREVVSFSERRAYAELAAKFKGLMPDSRSQSETIQAIGIKVIVEHIGRPAQ